MRVNHLQTQRTMLGIKQENRPDIIQLFEKTSNLHMPMHDLWFSAMKRSLKTPKKKSSRRADIRSLHMNIRSA